MESCIGTSVLTLPPSLGHCSTLPARCLALACKGMQGMCLPMGVFYKHEAPMGTNNAKLVGQETPKPNSTLKEEEGLYAAMFKMIMKDAVPLSSVVTPGI